MTHGMLLNVQKLTITISGKRLFSSLSFTVNRGEVVSLIGPNGCGKSTLLNAITSIQSGDAKNRRSGEIFGLEIDGSVAVAPGTVHAFLKQIVVPDDISKSDVTLSEGALRRVATDFCLDLAERDIGTMSAGMLQKLAIAELIARRADLYLLDEPSNFLDLPGIIALEHHISESTRRGAGVLLVTHDRELSDRVSDHTVYLAPQGNYYTEGGATTALELMESDYVSRKHRAESLKRKIEQLEKDFRARSGWAQRKEKSKRGAGGAKGFISHRSAKMARRAKAVQQRINRQRVELEATRPFVPKRVKLALPNRDIPNRKVFSLEGCSFRYADGPDWILKDISLGATAREKISLMGANGAGKSTLLRLADGTLVPNLGTAYRNDSVAVGVVPQGLRDYFPEPRLLDNFAFAGVTETQIRQYLGAAMLRREKVLQNIDELSQGELVRAAIVHAILSKADFLIMDEPTSHLDLESIMVLEEILSDFSGGYLIVSHDRSFVSNISSKLYYVEQGCLRQA
jgi:ATP-binding cassette subfamily F protein 3